ncbi:MAG: hypothetical protein AAFP70_05245, partial [Calditrichota bacterium]
MQIRSLVGYLLLSLLMTLPLFAEKSQENRQLEILENEVEATYRFADMRVSKESGTPMAIYRIKYPVKADTPENMARQYLLENAAMLRISDLANLEHFTTLETPGGFRVRFQQKLDGYKVYKSTIVVSLNRNNEVIFYASTYKPLARLASKAPSVSAEAAQAQAKQYLNIEGILNRDTQETVVYYNNGITRLAQKVTIIPAESMFGNWEVLIDAHTGEMFRAEDRATYKHDHKHGHGNTVSNDEHSHSGHTHSGHTYGSHTHSTHSHNSQRVDGTGQVFDPDPLTRARANYGGQFADNGDADNASLNNQRVAVTLRDVTLS